MKIFPYKIKCARSKFKTYSNHAYNTSLLINTIHNTIGYSNEYKEITLLLSLGDDLNTITEGVSEHFDCERTDAYILIDDILFNGLSRAIIKHTLGIDDDCIGDISHDIFKELQTLIAEKTIHPLVGLTNDILYDSIHSYISNAISLSTGSVAEVIRYTISNPETDIIILPMRELLGHVGGTTYKIKVMYHKRRLITQ